MYVCNDLEDPSSVGNRDDVLAKMIVTNDGEGLLTDRPQSALIIL